ncbi:MAG TPA: 3-mercaptopyruvate sulfurtransferase [Allosphingosinicella sp.]|nr:3-mercaptopyruvate sulfurtransferase [Allosphingosinicella sp.]
MDSLVSTDWLAGELGAADLRLLDATGFLPGAGRDARAEFEAGHIPGAVRFDLEEVSDPASALPHTWPPAHVFASRMRALGIGDHDRIVVYDNSPLHTSARAWWLLRSFGARQVAILDGGLAKWTAEGRTLESGAPAPRPGHFTAQPVAEAVLDKAQLLSLVGRDSHVIADARGADRFTGVAGEPRPGLAAGHIPGSRSLPQSDFFRADNSFKQGAALRAAFDAAGVDLSKPLVTTCGSGVTACVILFGAHRLGKTDLQLYDGSWSEWGADPETPKATGAAG